MKPLAHLGAVTLVWLIVIAASQFYALALLPIHVLLLVVGREKRAAAAHKKLEGTLMKSERVEAGALQARIASLINRRSLVAVTTSRVIGIERPLLGGFNMTDYQWKDLRDVKISENVIPGLFGARLAFKFEHGSELTIDGVPTEAAQTIYQHAQTEEQAWEEKRRIRELEQSRAASGGVLLNTGAGGADSTLDELERAKGLYDSGAISDAEYEEIKAKILSRQAF